MELLRTPRMMLRHWEESDLQAYYDLYSRDDVMRWLGSHPRRTLGMRDEGTTDRWFGLTAREFRKTLAAANDRGSAAPIPRDHREL